MRAELANAMLKPMLAFARAIAHQRRRRTEANQIGARRHQRGCARPCALSHGGCGVGTACLRRCKAEERRKRQPVVGNLCLDQQPRAPGTRSNSLTAPLPPPVIASAALRPDACSAEINCCHAASDGLMVRVSSEVEECLVDGERQYGQSQQTAWARRHIPKPRPTDCRCPPSRDSGRHQGFTLSAATPGRSPPRAHRRNRARGSRHRALGTRGKDRSRRAKRPRRPAPGIVARRRRRTRAAGRR